MCIRDRNNAGLRHCPICNATGNLQPAGGGVVALACGHVAHMTLSRSDGSQQEHVACLWCRHDLERLRSHRRLTGRYSRSSGSHREKVRKHFGQEHPQALLSVAILALSSEPSDYSQDDTGLFQGSPPQGHEAVQSLAVPSPLDLPFNFTECEELLATIPVHPRVPHNERKRKREVEDATWGLELPVIVPEASTPAHLQPSDLDAEFWDFCAGLEPMDMMKDSDYEDDAVSATLYLCIVEPC
eukprot:TRINITY_DN23894_c0_g1_i1.p1 TRINITY_DN23894_c0_g1~~TRINITY_DN23894_c0_g1_i1.p1  ORF type:complete len:242 (+),score=29.81 TRINITY_DN23894_c0_g1_i1:81-806(+)